jgi:hypothetical protein
MKVCATKVCKRNKERENKSGEVGSSVQGEFVGFLNSPPSSNLQT